MRSKATVRQEGAKHAIVSTVRPSMMQLVVDTIAELTDTGTDFNVREIRDLLLADYGVTKSEYEWAYRLTKAVGMLVVSNTPPHQFWHKRQQDSFSVTEAVRSLDDWAWKQEPEEETMPKPKRSSLPKALYEATSAAIPVGNYEAYRTAQAKSQDSGKLELGSLATKSEPKKPAPAVAPPPTPGAITPSRDSVLLQLVDRVKVAENQAGKWMERASEEQRRAESAEARLQEVKQEAAERDARMGDALAERDRQIEDRDKQIEDLKEQLAGAWRIQQEAAKAPEFSDKEAQALSSLGIAVR